MFWWLTFGVLLAIAFLVFRLTVLYGRLKRENEAYRYHFEALVASCTEQLRQGLAGLGPSYDTTLEALGSALDLKDAETAGHSKRVTAFTIAIARAMGLTREQIAVIARGAFLHDIGKMAIPDAILRKPGALTLDEIKVMRQYPYLGYAMLRKIPFLTDAAEIVYAHQEHFDGTGYPRGLKGGEIPLGARIVAIANSLDMITSDHPYRAAQSVQVANKEIELSAGHQFDPQIVSIFLAMPHGVWEDIRKDIQDGKV